MKQFFFTGTYQTQLRVGLYIKQKYNLFYVNIRSGTYGLASFFSRKVGLEF